MGGYRERERYRVREDVWVDVWVREDIEKG